MFRPQPREELILRRKHSLQPQQVIAKSVGISQGKYSMIESGQSDPDPGVAAQLTKMFDLPPSYFKDTSSNTDQAKEG